MHRKTTGGLAPHLALLIAALALTGAAYAQERVGSIEGTVLDASGATVAKATVDLEGGALKQSITTNAGGAFLFPSVPPGAYTLTVRQPGFATYKVNNLNVALGKITSVQAKLEVGQVSESVSVSAEAIQIDTATNVVATAVTADIYDRLPKGRSFDSLFLMQPGVRNEPRSGGFQTDGSSASENIFNIDGVEVTNQQNGLLRTQNQIPIEWVQETSVKSSGIDAQYGGAIGGVMNVSTKSGTNQFHGQLSYYLNTDGMNAGPRATLRLNPSNDNIADYFFNFRDGKKFQNPGFTLGGPVIKNKIWFFTSAYPQFTNYDRTVKFLRDGSVASFQRNDRQDFTLTRLDFQPFEKLRGSFGYQYNPYRVRGLLPSQQGTDNPANVNALRGQGGRTPVTSYNYQADWTASSKFLVSVYGGFQYSNYKDYGVPRGTYIAYTAPNLALPGLGLPVPQQYVAASGAFTPNNRQTVKDIYERHNLNVIGSYLLNAKGQHNLRFGYSLNRIHNSPQAATWPDGYLRIAWNLGYNAVTKPVRGARGPYGYYVNRVFATEGDVGGRNQGLFINDSWRVNRKLTLSLGIRTENEYIPSYRTDSGIQARAIGFGWRDKFAPRLGFAYDPTGTGKQKFSASWGMYYDLFKYELPRGSFGGDKWKDYVYTLDSGDLSRIQPGAGSSGNAGTFPGTLIEVVDWRIPSNDPSDNTIDPKLKPIRTQNFDVMHEYLFRGNWVARTRYTHRKMDRTIEDVGVLTPQGEAYFIANPGYGVTIDPAKWPKGYPANVTPKAKRDYDAVDFTVERRFAANYFFQTSYIWSRLYGNYAGLANSDENARTAPSVTRLFDEPWMAYDQKGKVVYGRLATDRPHTLKFFGSYDKKWLGGTMRLGPSFQLYSGTPISTQADVNAVPVQVYGRGDLGRTPKFTNTDLLLSHDFRFKGMDEKKRFRLEVNFQNLFNNNSVVNVFETLTHANDGHTNFDDTADIFKGYNITNLMTTQKLRRDPRYGAASDYQSPRQIRLGFHFFF